MHKSVIAPVKQGILSILHLLGYDLLKLPRHFDGQLHSVIQPVGTYSPWNVDTAFQQTYDRIKSHTLVDLYKCWELWTLVQEAAKLSGNIIEVGVWRGGSGALMAAQSQRLGLEKTVYLCDTFTGVVKAGKEDEVYFGGEHADTSSAIVKQLIGDIGLKKVQILEGVFPEDTGSLIASEQFCLCHIDVDVYESAKGVVEWIDSRMMLGGIYVYDDYGFANTGGITRWVDEQRLCRDRLVVHNLNGHAIVVKIA